MSDHPESVGKVKSTQKALDAMKMIADLSDEQVVRVGENIFRERILPLFLSPQPDWNAWIELTTSIQRPMDVVDSSGQVMFRCPAPLRSVPTSTTHTRANGFGEIAMRTESLSLQHPLMAMRYQEQMIQKRDADFDTAVIPEHQQMIDIMKRYGYVPNTDGPLSTLTASESATGPKPLFSADDEPL